MPRHIENTTENEPQQPQDAPEGTQAPQDTPEAPEDAQQPQDGPEDDAETFPRPYVEQLRRENAQHRTRAQQADDLARRLHTELVRATGRLVDPTDLPFDEAHLEDVDDLEAALDELLTRKPYLGRPVGDVGQGAQPTEPTVDLAGILRANAS